MGIVNVGLVNFRLTLYACVLAMSACILAMFGCILSASACIHAMFACILAMNTALKCGVGGLSDVDLFITHVLNSKTGR